MEAISEKARKYSRSLIVRLVNVKTRMTIFSRALIFSDIEKIFSMKGQNKNIELIKLTFVRFEYLSFLFLNSL